MKSVWHSHVQVPHFVLKKQEEALALLNPTLQFIIFAKPLQD